ncbi:hypothetical protein F5B18DRAFT_590130 [Nemania serpens]|nr:hypothetical protein F5B18DRAFT_590130 [Nemania serpens]
MEWLPFHPTSTRHNSADLGIQKSETLSDHPRLIAPPSRASTDNTILDPSFDAPKKQRRSSSMVMGPSLVTTL